MNGKINILKVEHNPGDIDLILYELTKNGIGFVFEGPTILFLDLNMPTLTGWEFMEKFEGFADRIKKQIKIYIVSSSVDHRDTERAKANKFIRGFISKPLAREAIRSLATI